MDSQGRMTLVDERFTEACRPTKSHLCPEILNFGNWNVYTMYAIGKAVQVTKEMCEYNIDILGIHECRWTGS